jgi:hypothetical protein
MKSLVDMVSDKVDTSLDVHILTDKREFKIEPCRVCKRPCAVTKFMAQAKVACNDHKERTVAPDKIREFDRSKETHVLTDKDKNKEVPCRSCGRPCVVTMFAAPDKVACKDCRTSVPRPKRVTKWERNGDSAVEVKTVEVFTVESFDKVYEPSLPFWPDGSPADRKRLIELATIETTLRLDLDEARADAIKARRNHTGSGDKPEFPSPAMIDLQAALEIAHENRRAQRRLMVDKLLKRDRAHAYDEVRDNATLEVERIPVYRQFGVEQEIAA